MKIIFGHYGKLFAASVFSGLLIAGVFVSGCRTSAKHASVPDTTLVNKQAKVPVLGSVSTDSTKLRPGLVLSVNVLVSGKPEIELVGKRISEKGSIALPLLGIVSVKELTLEELSAKLTASYSEFYVNPQVIVEFVRDDTKEGRSPWGSVTVLGRVKMPGKINIPATRDLTLSASIQQAGGFDTSAKETAIRITHRLADGTLMTREIDLHSVGAQGVVEDDVLLEPDDVVFVPEMVF